MVDVVRIIEQSRNFEDEKLWNKINRWWLEIYNYNWTWRQISKLLKDNKRQYWKWRGVCKAYKNPILESPVGQTSFENIGMTCRAQVISTTRGGMTWNMDWGFLDQVLNHQVFEKSFFVETCEFHNLLSSKEWVG